MTIISNMGAHKHGRREHLPHGKAKTGKQKQVSYAYLKNPQ